MAADDRQIISESPALQELQARLEATEAQLQQERLSVCYVLKIIDCYMHCAYSNDCLILFFIKTSQINSV